HLDPHSFPTRRSSDLASAIGAVLSGQPESAIAQARSVSVAKDRNFMTYPRIPIAGLIFVLGTASETIPTACANVCRSLPAARAQDRKSTRLNSSHVKI